MCANASGEPRKSKLEKNENNVSGWLVVIGKTQIGLALMLLAAACFSAALSAYSQYGVNQVQGQEALKAFDQQAAQLTAAGAGTDLTAAKASLVSSLQNINAAWMNSAALYVIAGIVLLLAGMYVHSLAGLYVHSVEEHGHGHHAGL